EMIPVGGAIVTRIETAVAADEHMPTIARIDPQCVLIGMHALAGIRTERLSAVARFVKVHAADVNVSLILGIDLDIAEVHRPRIEAIDALPGFAAVGRFVDAAVFKAVGPLLVLYVLHLASQIPARWTSGRHLRAIGE